MTPFARSAALAAVLAAGLAAAASADEVQLKFVTAGSPFAPINKQFYRPWTEKLNAAAKGALHVTQYDGSSLANQFNIYPRVLNDVVQIGFVLHNYVSGKFPLSEVASLPFMAETSAERSVALWRLYKSGALAHEYDQAVPLMLIGLPQSLLHLSHAPKSIDDLAGLKVVAPVKITSLSTEHLGMTPLTLGSTQIYEAMQRGVADGAVVSWNAYQAFKMNEVSRYHINAQMGTASGMIFMARKKYDSLPAAGRKAIDSVSGEAASKAWGAWWDNDNEKGRKVALADPSQTVVFPKGDELARWREKVEGALDDWVKDRKGGAEIIAKYRKILAQVKSGS